MTSKFVAKKLRVLASLIVFCMFVWCGHIDTFGQDGDSAAEVFGDFDDTIDDSVSFDPLPSDETTGDKGSATGPPLGEEPTIQELPESAAIPDVPSDETDGSTDEELPTQVEFEVIRERYPDGKVKIERQVTQDKDENYINHGRWVMYDQSGNEIIRGSYEFGQRDGEWFRWYDADDAKLFEAAPYNQYQGPFKSIANFSTGQLNGKWTFQDTSGRTISEWNFENGRRHGKSSWFYNNQRPMRVINYQNGELYGDMTEYDPNGTPITQVEYINGRRLEKITKYYEDDPQQKLAEGVTLRARYAFKEPDDWWKAEVARYTKEGKDEKHGKWNAWYPDGQMRMEGEYQYDQPSGKFTWWHKNGQKSLEASFSAGKKDNEWTWWHENGQRAIQGSYINGSPANRWIWWHANGKVSQRVDYSSVGAQIVNAPQVANPISNPPTRQPIYLQEPQN